MPFPCHIWLTHRRLRRVWTTLALTLVLGTRVELGHAHENTPGVLALKEVSKGQFLARWAPPLPAIEGLVVHLPEPCTIGGNSSFNSTDAPVLPSPMDCAGRDLVGEVRLTSSQAKLGPVAVNVEWRDHSQSLHLSQGTPPVIALGGTATSTGAVQVLRDYVGLGLEHILLGVDHLLFLLGLLLLVRGWRSLLATVTAFTLAHSVTLAAASLDLVKVATGPVEISIALSVLLLAVEASQPTETATRRWPWLVAFSFGLLHGLGFASALSEVGLPKHAKALALLGFNLGVELGQLMIVGVVALGFYWLSPRQAARSRVEAAAIGLLASCSTFWLLQRLETWLTSFAS